MAASPGDALVPSSFELFDVLEGDEVGQLVVDVDVGPISTGEGFAGGFVRFPVGLLACCADREQGQTKRWLTAKACLLKGQFTWTTVRPSHTLQTAIDFLVTTHLAACIIRQLAQYTHIGRDDRECKLTLSPVLHASALVNHRGMYPAGRRFAFCLKIFTIAMRSMSVVLMDIIPNCPVSWFTRMGKRSTKDLEGVDKSSLKSRLKRGLSESLWTSTSCRDNY